MVNSRTRLLVIDDDLGTVETFRLILRIEGFETSSALSGEEGLSTLRAQPDGLFGLVLLDLRLPDIFGLEVLADIQLRGPTTPIVMISAWWTDASSYAAKRLGAVELLHKPLDAIDLVHAVRSNLDSQSRPGSVSHGEHAEIGHATRRWVEIVARVASAKEDVPTLPLWASSVGESLSTLKARCVTAGVQSAGDALDFARFLRVVMKKAGHEVDWLDELAVLDARTLHRLLGRAGLSHHDIVPELAVFLRNQSFVTNQVLLKALLDLLQRH